MAKQYNRISSEDPSKVTTPAETTTARNRRAAASNTSTNTNTNTISSHHHQNKKQIMERISEKVQALLWVGFAIFIARVTDTPNVILSSSEPIRSLLHIAITQLTINFLLMVYLGVYLSKVKGLKDSEAWNIYCPRIIKFMTMNGIISVYTLTRSLWPVWGFLTPLVLSIEFVGLLFATHFIPAL